MFFWIKNNCFFQDLVIFGNLSKSSLCLHGVSSELWASALMCTLCNLRLYFPVRIPGWNHEILDLRIVLGPYRALSILIIFFASIHVLCTLNGNVYVFIFQTKGSMGKGLSGGHAAGTWQDWEPEGTSSASRCAALLTAQRAICPAACVRLLVLLNQGATNTVNEAEQKRISNEWFGFFLPVLFNYLTTLWSFEAVWGKGTERCSYFRVTERSVYFPVGKHQRSK